MTNIPRPEHPRPQFVRENWMNLNGTWDFQIDQGNSGIDRKLYVGENFYRENASTVAAVGETGKVQKITVPFCPESRLSGIGYTDFMAAVWYRRSVTLTKDQLSGKVLLHFGAVDYHAILWVNEQKVGEHTGGYASFTLDITAFVHEGENTLVLYAEDDIRTWRQPYGKQCGEYYSKNCSYTRTTGIWQTVWLEFVPNTYIRYAKVTPFPKNSYAVIELETSGNGTVTAEAFYNGKSVGKTEATAVGYAVSLTLPVSELHLWDVGSPELYDLVLTLTDSDGTVDTVNSYFGMRTVELHHDGLYLNGKPLFMRTILDQGFNPEGIYTGPTDEFLKHDIELSMALGFNGARFHQRVFEERSLYWADKLGYIVWGEYANGTRVDDVQWAGDFLREWTEVVRRDYSHPSIIGWCPQNETYWWFHGYKADCQELIYRITKQIDPYRPVIDASGGTHYTTDMFDIHDYDQDPENLRKNLAPMVDDPTAFHNPIHNWPLKHMVYEGQPYWISEYGGTYWNPTEKEAGWGYGDGPKTEEEFGTRYAGLTKVLLENPRVCGFCYTQLTDIEQEKNGLYYYDRAPKFSPAIYDMIRKANRTPAAMEQEGK